MYVLFSQVDKNRIIAYIKTLTFLFFYFNPRSPSAVMMVDPAAALLTSPIQKRDDISCMIYRTFFTVSPLCFSYFYILVSIFWSFVCMCESVWVLVCVLLCFSWYVCVYKNSYHKTDLYENLMSSLLFLFWSFPFLHENVPNRSFL